MDSSQQSLSMVGSDHYLPDIKNQQSTVNIIQASINKRLANRRLKHHGSQSSIGDMSNQNRSRNERTKHKRKKKNALSNSIHIEE